MAGDATATGATMICSLYMQVTYMVIQVQEPTERTAHAQQAVHRMVLTTTVLITLLVQRLHHLTEIPVQTEQVQHQMLIAVQEAQRLAQRLLQMV